MEGDGKVGRENEGRETDSEELRKLHERRVKEREGEGRVQQEMEGLGRRNRG